MSTLIFTVKCEKYSLKFSCEECKPFCKFTLLCKVRVHIEFTLFLFWVTGNKAANILENSQILFPTGPAVCVFGRSLRTQKGSHQTNIFLGKLVGCHWIIVLESGFVGCSVRTNSLKAEGVNKMDHVVISTVQLKHVDCGFTHHGCSPVTQLNLHSLPRSNERIQLLCSRIVVIILISHEVRLLSKSSPFKCR